MTFATYVRDLTSGEMAALGERVARAKFRPLPGRGYMVSEVFDFWEPCERAFFLHLKAGGSIHRHTDEFIKGSTHHLVWTTNTQCENWWMEDGQERVCHMEAGKRYLVERAPLHWSFNHGDTDRIHLLVEF